MPALKEWELERGADIRWRKQSTKSSSLFGKQHTRRVFADWCPPGLHSKKRSVIPPKARKKARSGFIHQCTNPMHVFLYKRRKVYVGLVEREFSRLSTEWKETTRHWSSVTKMVAHPDYLRIIGLAATSKKEVERLLLQELRNEPDYWFAALTAISGEDPASADYDFDQAVNAWLEWGDERGIK